MNELLVNDKDYDIGMEIASSSIGRNGTNSFTLSSNARELLLSDFSRIHLDSSEDYGNSGSERRDDDSHRWLYMGLL